MLDYKTFEYIKSEIIATVGGKEDGSRKNIICTCPHCGKAGKFGIYVGKEIGNKKQFTSNCFKCGRSTRTLDQLLDLIGRPDLKPKPTTDIDEEIDVDLLFKVISDDDEVDDSLSIIELPDFYKRTFNNEYLKGRGFSYDDYDFFEAGTTRGFNFKFDDYVVFPIYDDGDVVGYVSRHTWSKDEIDCHNAKAKTDGTYKILRYRNSNENEFAKLLYNYDRIIEGETDTVVLLEGIFDVIALTRKFDLYDNHHIVPVATFGKKISDIQIYKLQSKGVRNIVVAYDGDAVEVIKKVSENLSQYFPTVLIADIYDPEADIDSMNDEEAYELFAYDLKTVTEYKLNRIQIK